jgi:AmiR/NasT family two-component response regulator
VRVLIAEDESLIRLDLRQLLERAGLEVRAEAHDGEEAVELARELTLVNRAAEAGVYGYLAKPFREEDVVPALATARARFDELAATREEVVSLEEALAARKAIERAKGLLMAKQGLTEDAAFGRLRKASQVSGRPMRVIADAIVATLS